MKVRKFSLVVACIGATLLASCGKSGGGMPNFGDNEFAVRTIASSNAALQTTYPATIKGIQDVEVRPKVSGFITKVLVHEGQTVAAGQVLFTIDSETYAAAVRQAQAAVNTAKAQLSTAKLTMDNNKKLYDKAIIGQYEYTSSANSYATAQAQVAQTEAALASAREQLAWCSVKSPAAGVVGSLPFKAGALVSASGQALTTVSDVSTVEVFFSVSESELLALSKTNGSTQAAIASFPELKLKLADGSIYNHPGKVVKMSGVLDATTGSVSLIAHFANPDKLLKSGGADICLLLLAAHGGSEVVGVTLTLGQFGSLVYLLLIALLGDGDNLHTVGELGDTLGHDAVTHVQTRGHDVSLAVVLGVDGYLGIFHLVVLGHYIHEGLGSIKNRSNRCEDFSK